MENKKIALVIIILIIVFFGVFFIIKRLSSKEVNISQITPTEIPLEVLPTVTTDVKVNLKYGKNKGEVVLTVSDFPPGTSKIDYELSYITDENLPKGVLSSIEIKPDETSLQRDITLGTCSRGVCHYDNVTGPINVVIKFYTSTEKFIFQKEFEL